MKTILSLLFVLTFALINSYAATFGPNFEEAPAPGQAITVWESNTYPRNIKVTQEGRLFSFANLSSFGRVLSPNLGGNANIGFTLHWGYPAKAVTLTYLDNQADDDTVLLRAFNCSGQQIGQTVVVMPGNGTTVTSRQLTLAARGVCSVFVYGGTNETGHSVYYDNLVITTDNNPNAFSTRFASDYTAFRPSNGTWYIDTNYSTLFNQTYSIRFGAAGDKPVPADYSGDAAADYGIYRNGVWYLGISCGDNTGNVSLLPSICSNRGVAFGSPDDLPLPADYDGDGKADVAVWRPSNGTWYILNSSNNQVSGIQFGQSGDVPISGYFDGDDRADTAIFRPANGTWYILGTQTGFRAVQFGQAGDRPVSADYDGDTINDVAVYRNGIWYILQSSNGQVRGTAFGLATDFPIPGNYRESNDSYESRPDGKANIAVFRPSNGTWYVLTENGFYARQWGQQDDIPISLVNN